MSHYRLDRFAFAASPGIKLNTTGLPAGTPAPPPAPAGKVFVRPTLSPGAMTTLSIALANETDGVLKDHAAQPVPETHSSQTDQQLADQELARLQAQVHDNETDVLIAQAGDPGALPEPRSPLVYIAAAVGAVVLIGGAFALAKPKAKMGGYRKKRSHRRRR